MSTTPMRGTPPSQSTPAPRTPKSRTGDRHGWLILISVLVIALDRVTKIWVGRHIELGSGIPVIPHIFRISHVMNSGAAFSLFGDSSSPNRVRWFLIGFSLLAAVAVAGFLVNLGRRFTGTTVALALILGGALGNVYDRIRYGYVTDFLEVHIVHYHWPDFNIADSAICIGAILIVLDSLRPRREGE